MSDHATLAASILWVGSLVCQLTLLVMQLRTYRRTRHSSLRVLAIATISGVLYLAAAVATGLEASRTSLAWKLYLAAVIAFVFQVALQIWGTASLFRAFEGRPARGAGRSGGSGAEVPSDSNAEAAPLALAGSWAGTLACVFRLWTLRRVANVAASVSERSMVLLAAVSLVLWTGADWLSAGPGATFDVFAIPAFSAVVLMLLVLALALGRPSRPPLPYRQSLFIILAVLPLLIVLKALTEHYLGGLWVLAAYAVLVIYTTTYAWRALHIFSGARQPLAVVACIALVCGYGWFDHVAYIDPSLWEKRDLGSTADSGAQPGSGESLLFDQQRRIDAALGRVAAGDGSKPSVFFVGFAGVAAQKVFAEEINLASRVVDGRFDTAHRQLLLINDHRDREAYPLATVSGLHYGLSAIARKMNLQQDILFLSLSSHGSADPELSVSNGALDLEQLTDENLLQALRDAGIRRRIIVISACHAGAFIHALEDPDTIIITAAAPDKTSFGCSDDRDLTYFGEAFYRDALPKARSLEEAFSQAKAAIARREGAEHVTPSDPQAYFGADLVRLLAQHPMLQPGAAAH